MNGAEALLQTLARAGSSVCFANPGTSEMHFVAALERVPQVRAILCLFEGVATGAADGYGRIAARPAITLLHLGPGLANGLANLHNARRAASPIVNIVGDHATHHLLLDAPLTSDIAAIARPVSHWVHSSVAVGEIGSDAARAVQAARTPPGQIATLILPADVSWSDGAVAAAPLEPLPREPVPADLLEMIARAMSADAKVDVLLRGEALHGAALDNAGKIAAANGCRLLCDTFAPRLPAGAGTIPVQRIPYFAEQIVEFFAATRLLVLVGAAAPVAFFAYPNRPGWCLPAQCSVLTLARADQDATAAMAQLCDRLHATTAEAQRVRFEVEWPFAGKLNAYAVGRVLAHYLPEGAIISDDGATSSAPVLASLATARPHTQLSLTGGAIGQGLPLAIGAAIARPEAKVVCLSGDGAALYTVQALWTMARERLNIVVIVFANRAYKILKVELARVAAAPGGPLVDSLLSLDDPRIGWRKLGEAFGVESIAVNEVGALDSALREAMEGAGPRLIEVELG